MILATLLPVDWSLYRVVPEAQAFSDHADVAAWLAAQGQPGTFRVYSPSYSLPQHVAQRAGLELADGVDPMQVAGYARLMQAATGARAQWLLGDHSPVSTQLGRADGPARRDAGCAAIGQAQRALRRGRVSDEGRGAGRADAVRDDVRV